MEVASPVAASEERDGVVPPPGLVQAACNQMAKRTDGKRSNPSSFKH